MGPKSQARRLSKRDVGGVNLVETCQFLIHPPEPLSLRLHASLMMGIARIYGQQWQQHFAEVQGFFGRVTARYPPSSSSRDEIYELSVKQVSPEAITMAPTAHLEGLSDLADSVFNLQLDLNAALATPERARAPSAASNTTLTLRSAEQARWPRPDSSLSLLTFGADLDLDGGGVGGVDHGLSLGPPSPSTVLRPLSLSLNEQLPEQVGMINAQEQQLQSRKRGPRQHPLFDDPICLDRASMFLGPAEGLWLESPPKCPPELPSLLSGIVPESLQAQLLPNRATIETGNDREIADWGMELLPEAELAPIPPMPWSSVSSIASAPPQVPSSSTASRKRSSHVSESSPTVQPQLMRDTDDFLGFLQAHLSPHQPQSLASLFPIATRSVIAKAFYNTLGIY